MRVSDVPFRGLRVPVEIRGAGADDLVYLSGLGVHPGYYGAGLERLGSRFTVYAPDLSFRTQPSLFRTVEAYRECVRTVAERVAPDAIWAGHSFGGLLALLGRRPAIALAPTVPLDTGWPGIVGRLLRLQIREYAGKEGLRGVSWAWRIMLDYVATAVTRPGSLFPVGADLLEGPAERFRPTAPRAEVLLAAGDSLYREDESRRFLELAGDGYGVERLPLGHDWPVTEPELLAKAIRRAARRLSETRRGPARD